MPLNDTKLRRIDANYQPSEEHMQEQNYKLELELRKLKRCL
ncbi:Uncharacterised protein [Salmonella enterica subsp. houtenae]|nr:Uncharacterised protein [Salmonella enterica subsp. houtenae]